MGRSRSRRRSMLRNCAALRSRRACGMCECGRIGRLGGSAFLRSLACRMRREHRGRLVLIMAAPAIDELTNPLLFQRIATFRHSDPSVFLQEYFQAYIFNPTFPIAVFLLLSFLVLGMIGVQWSLGHYGINGLADFGF